MSAWDDLSMHERHQFIRTAVRNGIRDPLEIRKQYNSFEEGGDTNTEPVYDAGTLPDFIVKRSEDPIYKNVLTNKNIDDYSKRIIGDEYDNPQYNRQFGERFVKIYNEAGKPKINKNEKLAAGKHSNGEPRAYIHMPFIGKGSMYITNFSDIIAESAHPIQRKYGKNKMWKERLNPFYDADTPDKYGLTRYQNPSKFEFETHTIVEPIIDDYLRSGNISTESFEDSLKSIPKITQEFRDPFLKMSDTEKSEYWDHILDDDKYAEGGPLNKPFSHNPIPKVRY